MRLLKLIALIFLASCTTTTIHGVIIQPEDISVIIPNVTRMEDVKTLLGQPSFKWKEQWYYVNTVKEYRAFFMPKVKYHNMYIIAFNKNIVLNVEHFTEKDIVNKKVEMQKIQTQKPNLKELFD